MISVSNVSMRYGSKVLFEDVSVAFIDGRRYGLTEKGVPSFSPIQDSRTYFNYHHTAADTFDKVDPRQLAETAAINTVLAYALADSPDPAPR